MGMAGDDKVNTLHLFGQPLILRQLLFFVGPTVGQANNELRPLALQGIHAPPGIFLHIAQNKARGGGTCGGIFSHQSENAIGHATPLQQHIILNSVCRHGALDIELIRIFRRRLVI